MFSINSFHDLVIPISLNLNGSELLSFSFFLLLSLFLFFFFCFPLFCSHSKVSLCFSIITLRSFLSAGSRPTIQSTCDSLLLLSGNPITPTIYLSSSHSILCLCLFNTRWSCLPGIGCLRCDAERFPIDGVERMGRRDGGGGRLQNWRRKEKRPSRWASKVFWTRKHRGGLFTTERERERGPKSNGK